MAIIAVAGGTGKGLGRHVVTACAKSSKHKVIVLSRETSDTPDWLKRQKDVKVRKVDYSSEESLIEALNGVDTLISTTLSLDPPTHAAIQIALLNAGLKAGISRFSPADWGYGQLNYEHIEMFQPRCNVWNVCRAVAAQYPDRFEWGAFHVGAYMNYLGKERHPDDWTGFGEWKFCWNVKDMTAALPVTRNGESPRITMTALSDIGKVVSAACELPFGEWEEFMGVAGDVKTLDEVTAIIEKVRGKKMKRVDYLSIEMIEGLIKNSSNLIEKMWWELHLELARDEDDNCVFENNLEEDVLDGKVKLMTIKDFVKKNWQ